MKEEKHFTVDLVVSEYHMNDEGFYTVKRNMEISNGKTELLKSFDKIVLEVRKYIKEVILKNNG